MVPRSSRQGWGAGRLGGGGRWTRGPAPRPDGVDDLANLLLAVAAVLRVGAWDSAKVTAHEPPTGGIAGAARVLAHPWDPWAACDTPMPGPAVYWAVTTVLLLAVAGLVTAVVSWWRRDSRRRVRDPRLLPGMATRAEVVAAAGTKAVLRRVTHTRPNLADPATVRAGEVGYLLGRSHGVNAWASMGLME